MLMKSKIEKHPTFQNSNVNFWPGFIDVFVSVLMIFFLIAFLRLVLNTEAFEMLLIRSSQERFVKEFSKEFEKEMENGTIKIESHGNLQQITFSSEVLFNSGEAILLERGEKLLARLIIILDRAEKRARFKQIQVEGHTDNVQIKGELQKKFATNWELSAQRAINVVKYFYRFVKSKPGMGRGLLELKRDIFSGTGYADLRPVSSNDTPEGRALNRRIEIRVVYFNDLEKNK
jgi:chemotaxis protein MotB